MQKAYDRVEWKFLRKTLTSFGFNQQWIETVMFCVENTQLSILLNGTPQTFFKPTRGLRQGDPLSSYLFVLCAEALSTKLALAHQQNSIKGIQICRGGQKLTHMAFADDLIFFGEATMAEARAMNDVLEVYCRFSGQTLNINKSRAQFSPNVSSTTKRQLREFFQISPTTSLDTYLGIPFVNGKLSKRHCDNLVSRVSQKLQHWKTQHLSPAGKIVLVQSTLSVLPQYSMSCFKLPVSVQKTLDSISRRFYWSNGVNNQVPTISWNTIGMPRRVGGLSIKLSSLMNTALLAKKRLELLTFASSLWVQLMRKKYFPSTSFFHAKCPNSSSWGWKSVYSSKEFLVKDLLNQRGFNMNPLCALCQEHAQSANHLFFDCPLIKGIWQQKGLISLFSSQDIGAGIRAVANLPKDSSREDRLKASLFCSIIWFIWNGYWDLIFRQMNFNPRHIILRAIAHSREHMQLSRPKGTRDTQWVSWIPPQYPFVKFNVDGARKGNPGPAGIGGVCRSETSVVVCGFSQGIGFSSALIAEALAIRRAMRLAIEMGHLYLIIESDNLLLTRILSGVSSSIPWRVKHIVEDCRALSSCFLDISFVHSLREANAVADTLASLGASFQQNLYWQGPPPSCIFLSLFAGLSGIVFQR
ncbi:uncharacterized protein LOC122645112 [Telopea speciosissima]|uniref:uncharacterized protein LOC122645112 n=1 Tax=Telopea speciosissima TaxID=54955 RepID=UPI001CC620DE|nr:uncharacterized protein LOC122645112 [Telopea speciosissima]